MLPTNDREISPAELEARLRLHRLPELGPKGFKKLIEAFGSASKAISAPASAWRSLGLKVVSADARRCEEVRDGASAALAWLERPAQHLLMWDQPDYPALLAELDDAPRYYSSPATRRFWRNRSWRWSAAVAPPGQEWIPPPRFPAAWRVPVLSSPVALPWVSTVLLTRRLWMLVDIQSACWAPGSKIFIHSAIDAWPRR